MKFKEEGLYGKIAKIVDLICNNPAVYFSEMDILFINYVYFCGFVRK